MLISVLEKIHIRLETVDAKGREPANELPVTEPRGSKETNYGEEQDGKTPGPEF